MCHYDTAYLNCIKCCALMTKIGLRFWIILCSVLPALLVGILLSVYFNYKQHQEMEQHLREQAANIALPLAISSQQLLQQQQLHAIQPLLENMHRLNTPAVFSISLFAADGTLLSSSNSQHTLADEAIHQLAKKPAQLNYYEQKNHLLVYQPLPVSDASKPNTAGYLLLQLAQQHVQLRQDINVLQSGLIISAVLALACYLALLVLQKLQPSLQRLNDQLLQLADGQYRLTSHDMRIRELSQLQHGIIQLSDNLSRLEQDMQQNIEQVTSDLQQSMEQLEIQNIQLDFAKRKALEDNRQKSDFLAKMSHELRTPLNAVIGFTRQLLKTQLNPNQSDYLHTIQKSANSLLNLVNDVLDFSRLEEGRMSINPEPFSLRDVLNDATELLAANAFDKQLELVLIIDPDCPDDIIADPARITQVLMNIAGNAIKFTEHGSIVIDVNTTATHDDFLMLHIAVKDTGRGISQERQAGLFESFTPIEQHDQQSGSGLGLIISKRLVQAMHGAIGYESKLAEGSTFWFTVKCQHNPISVTDALPLAQLNGKTVLYFEPQQHSRDATLQLLNSWGLQVTVCSTKAQLQQALMQQGYYDIGLLGRAVAINQVNEIITMVQQLQQQCRHVYLLVNTLSPNLRETLLSSGATACLPKPAHHRKLAITLAQPYSQPLTDATITATPQLLPIRVLTVDDNEANLKLINTLLREQVQQLDTASDGAQAWQKTTQHVYDIIFMDINMPVMDGIAACQRIRQNSLNEHTPIVAVTAHAVDGERARLISLGFNEFLTKPLDEQILHCTLQEYCRLQKNTAEPIVVQPTTAALIDWPMALQRAAGKSELAQEMLLLLIKSLPLAEKHIQQAISDNDPQGLLHTIHKLHGACCYTGVPRLKTLLETIETQLKKGASITTLEPELYELDDVIQMLLVADTALPQTDS